MRTFRTFALASSLLLVPLGAAHAQTAPPSASGQPAAPTAQPAAPAASAQPSAQPPAPAAEAASQPAPASAPAAVDKPASAPADTSTPASAELSIAPAAPAPARKLTFVDGIAGGVGLASIAVGLALVGAAAGVQGEIRGSAPKDLHGNPVCGRLAAADADPNASCADLRAKARLGTDMGNAGIGLLVTGGILVVAATAYWLVPASPPASSSRASRASRPQLPQVIPVAGTTGGGLVVVGSF